SAVHINHADHGDGRHGLEQASETLAMQPYITDDQDLHWRVPIDCPPRSPWEPRSSARRLTPIPNLGLTTENIAKENSEEGTAFQPIDKIMLPQNRHNGARDQKTNEQKQPTRT